MERLSSYPSIYAIGHRYIADLFCDEVLVEEKIDGSQFSFGLIDGEIMMKSKGAIIRPEDPGMFAAAARTVAELKEVLAPGWTYRAEYLSKPKHNVLTYGRVPTKNLILFDITTAPETYAHRTEKEFEAVRLGLEVVPVLFRGLVPAFEKLSVCLDTDSILGNVKIEGIVVKNYSRFGIDKKILIGKFVSEAFKETHNKEWKASNPVLNDVVDRLVETLRTEARWQKAVQHLTERDAIESSPRDIGNLIAEVKRDVLAEESEFIKDKLYEWAKDRIARSVVGGLPEWYKKYLAEKAFEK